VRRVAALESLPEIVTLREQRADERMDVLLTKPFAEVAEEFDSLLREISDEKLFALVAQLEEVANADQKQASAN
jgi:hypothetical protein